ncbi:Imm7 family immunity protein [Kitasatospora sp. NPDC018058]|uniref:Imm7 family immunity protein n=1 Tax=Kitasatospora sp. NPDC018058 TaxID=3364025 RepID=UPI0037C16D7A
MFACLLDLRWRNGAPFLHFRGWRNHRDAEVLDFFREVGRRAPGSYGLLHVRDDEDLAHENGVRVLRMARDEVSEHQEPLLSPCIPVLEDPLHDASPGAWAGLEAEVGIEFPEGCKAVVDTYTPMQINGHLCLRHPATERWNLGKNIRETSQA